MKLTSTILTATLFAALAAGAEAQEMEGHGMMAGDDPMTSGRIQLPDICLTAAEEEAAMPMGMAPDMDEAHTALADGMDEMNQLMMTGMMAEDIDVAFVCGMIPHHQSAVNMARAELEHGDDDWAKELAQKVIDSQQQEIEDMLAWLEERAAAELAQ